MTVENSKIYFPANVIYVCVNGISESGSYFGKVKHISIADSIIYHDFAEMLLKVDEVFDRQGFPQSWQTKRSFQDNDTSKSEYCFIQSEVLIDTDKFNEKGVLKTFQVIVNSRRNASWQGRILSEEGKQIGIFHSDLELLKIIMKELD